MNNDALQLELIVLFWMSVKAQFFEFLPFLFVFLKGLDILDTELFSQLKAFLGVGLEIQLIREKESGVNFCVHKHIIVENDSLQVNEKDIGNYIEDVSFGGVCASVAGLTKAVTYQLTSMHALEC